MLVYLSNDEFICRWNMKRAYYSSSVNEFTNRDSLTIFGEITSNDQFAADDLQKKL